MWSHQYPSAQTQISKSVGSPSTTGRDVVAVKVWIPGPDRDERKTERRLDVPLPARPFAVHEAEPFGGNLCLGHPWLDDELAMLHRSRRDLVREPHALDLLRRLDGACLREQRRRVPRVHRTRRTSRG